MRQPLWEPKELSKTQIVSFFGAIDSFGEFNSTNAENGNSSADSDYSAMHAFSIAHPDVFWREVWRQYNLVGEGDIVPSVMVTDESNPMLSSRWFPNLMVNYAENCLQGPSSQIALHFFGEDGSTMSYTFAELRDRVLTAAALLQRLGIAEGDRVAGFVPNHPETIVLALATSALGAVWTSCSPDFGVNGVVDRFGQTEPKVLVMADGYFYNGKRHDCITKAIEFLPNLPSVNNVIVFNYAGSDSGLTALDTININALSLDEALSKQRPLTAFVKVPFNAPLFILYSSGTTGAPKCIVHSVGGTLIQHVKEHRLHADIRPGDRLFYFTTCGWMMWNWLISGLASHATLILFDGSPFYPTPSRLYDLCDEAGITHFGTSAKYIDACAKEGLVPRTSHDLSALRAILSTGSPLVTESFRYVYEAIKADLHLASISGGTDIVSCFVLGAPNLPVYAGEIQAAGLGLNVRVLDENGEELPIEEKGELSCISPFPSMPIGFFNDPDGTKYFDAYFSKIDGVWCHGDFILKTEQEGYIILGRSDAVLNPGGVRIGTAEIYRQVEQIDEVLESIVIGQQLEDDVRVVLFVRLRDGVNLDDSLITAIKKRIRSNTTPRHVPAVILEVEDIPRTRSGKIVELAVRNVVHQQPVKNSESLLNPEALDYFRNRPELKV